MADDIIVKLSPFNHFLLHYGRFLSSWHSFEILIEVLIMRELRLTVEKTCIVTAGLGFGAKVAIANALLARKNDAEGVRLISQVQQAAERNSFAHSFLSIDSAHENFTQVRREVKKSLSVRLKKFSPRDMQAHTNAFFAKYAEAQKHLGITDAAMVRYQQKVESFAPVPKVPEAPPLESPTSYRSSKRKYRAERRAQKRQPKSA
jgi:hypothetical protein